MGKAGLWILTLALAAPPAAVAMPSPAGTSAGPPHPVAQLACRADARVAIILQRKPTDRKPPPKRGR